MKNAITVRDISKVYHVYESPRDRLKELLSITKKKYYREFYALEKVSFEVGRGEAVGIIGRNGSGKSTLLQIICGILKPTAGSVQTSGRISALLELGTGFNPEFTGLENVYLNGALMGYSKEEIDERLQGIMDFADIGEFIRQPVKTYSSGMYVRLAFACAVSVEPDILIVDEALSVGDVFFQQKCYRKMDEFRERGKTMLLVSHALDAIQKNCERAVFLDAGRMVEMGASKDVINRYLETVLLRGETMGKVAGPEAGQGGKGPRGGGLPKVDDRCAGKANYNRSEFRYGNFKGSIVDFSTTDQEGREVTAISSGQALRFRFEVEFSEDVEFPVYGFIIKTKKGATVFGCNTWQYKVPVEPKSRGDRVTIEFVQNTNLVAGDYFISAGVAELKGDEAVPVDRRYDLAYLRVMAVDKSFGLANLFPEIGIRDGGIAE